MKQIGLALHNYHETNNCFPPANLPFNNGGLTNNCDFSADARVLGGLEQQVLYNAINWYISSSQNDPLWAANATVSGTRLSVFLCPSDRVPYWSYGGYMSTGNDYFASFGSNLEFNFTETGGPPNGPFGYAGPAIGIQNVTDGTSNTIGFGEWKIGDGSADVLTIPTDVVFAGTYPAGVTRNTPSMTMAASGGAVLNGSRRRVWPVCLRRAAPTTACRRSPVQLLLISGRWCSITHHESQGTEVLFELSALGGADCRARGHCRSAPRATRGGPQGFRDILQAPFFRYRQAA